MHLNVTSCSRVWGPFSKAALFVLALTHYMILLPIASPALPLSPIAHSLLFSLPWSDVYQFGLHDFSLRTQVFKTKVEITFLYERTHLIQISPVKEHFPPI